MRVLVSGATGFMGRSISSNLLLSGHSVRAMSRTVAKAQNTLADVPGAQVALEEGRLTFAAADVTDPSSLREAVGAVDAVVQCAQFPGAPVEDPRHGLTYMSVDRDGTLNLLEAVAAAYGARTAGPGLTRFPEGAPRFLYLSGITVSESAPETWNRAKWQAEEAIRGSGLEWTIVRSCWAYGPGDAALNRIMGYSDFLPFVPIFGNGEESLSPVFVDDVGRLFARLVGEPDAGRDTTIPLGGAEVVTMNEFLKVVLEVMGRTRPILHVPKTLGKIPAFGLQYLPGRPLSPGAVDFSSQGGVADLTILRERLPDFTLTPMRTALRTYMGS